MKPISIILVALVSLATISKLALAEHSNSRAWLQYKRQHGKVYATPEEDAQRFSLFLAAKDRIRRHNADVTASYTLGLNQFSDLTRDELAKLTGLDRPKATGNRSTPANVVSEHPLLRAILDDPAPLPKEVDWRKAGRVTEVKNEREKYQCLADYAFVAAGLLEGQLLVRQPNRTKVISLSAQQQIDCTPDSYGCLGNGVQNTLDYIVDAGGLESEHDYPYLGTTVKTCLFDKSKVVLAPSGYLTLPENDDDALKKAVATFGPVAVLMQTGDTFAQYKSGIYKDPTCIDPANNRYLLVVGYGIDEVEGEYWILKNSWGTGWGEQGYMRLKRGMCQIAFTSVILTFAN